jgi:hypothetical protein
MCRGTRAARRMACDAWLFCLAASVQPTCVAQQVPMRCAAVGARALPALPSQPRSSPPSQIHLTLSTTLCNLFALSKPHVPTEARGHQQHRVRIPPSRPFCSFSAFASVTASLTCLLARARHQGHQAYRCALDPRGQAKGKECWCSASERRSCSFACTVDPRAAARARRMERPTDESAACICSRGRPSCLLWATAHMAHAWRSCANRRAYADTRTHTHTHT